jgi:hypothetical protein
MSFKIENSRRVAKSRPVCMDLDLCTVLVSGLFFFLYLRFLAKTI